MTIKTNEHWLYHLEGTTVQEAMVYLQELPPSARLVVEDLCEMDVDSYVLLEPNNSEAI
jgi:hypothetical protein